MHLRRLRIQGFRSIKELDLYFEKGKNVIIGRNNAGKSNIIRALDLVLGESSPAYARSENVTEADFHYQRTIDKDGGIIESVVPRIFIWCELERAVNEQLNWHDINKCFGFSFYGTKNSGIAEAIRINLENLGEDYPSIFEINEDATYEKVWVDAKLKNQHRFETHLGPMGFFAYAFCATLNEQGIQKQIRFLYREDSNHDWILAFKASVRTELLQSAILPAFRDPATQLRINQWTWFGKLMRHLTRDCKNDEALKGALASVQTEGDRIFVGINERIENDALSVSFPDARLSIQFHGDTDAELYKNCGLYIDDGYKSPLVDKGAGIQSATVIGLFSYYTREVNTVSSSLLCIEEPELYLHPHARRVISDRLDKFLDGNRNQVIMTTHGVEFLRTALGNFNLVMVRKESAQGTIAQTINAKDFLDLLINNNQNELFFADKVILCEGFEEYLIRSAAEELFPGEIDRQNVSIISVEGKDRLVRMAKIVLNLGIRCYIFCDFDFLLRDSHRVDGVTSPPRKSVEHLPDSFFGQSHVRNAEIPVTKGNVVKLRNKLRKDHKEAFYYGKHVREIDYDHLPRHLTTLRKCGLGILDGEVEDLSLDKDWICAISKKLSLEKVYELREQLSSGRHMKELFTMKPFEDLLTVVFGR